LEEWLYGVAENVSHGIDAIAILIIGYGAIEAFIGILRVMVLHASDAAKRTVWLRFAQWLVAGLTFQLAADVVGTSGGAGCERQGQNYLCAGLELFFMHTGPTFNVMAQLFRQGHPASAVMESIAALDAQRTYQPCPCGSGKKFRFCHGDRAKARPPLA
jgi:hypothetical protein